MDVFRTTYTKIIFLSSNTISPSSDASLGPWPPALVSTSYKFFTPSSGRLKRDPHGPEYLIDTMRRRIHYFCVREGKAVIALASSEMDGDSFSAEMMDFATLPDWRRQGLACRLLSQMEREMKRFGMLTAYTIARVLCPGVNITFVKMGYNYAGTLKNN